MISLQQWAITWGILIQYFIQYGASFAGGGSDDPNQSTIAFRIPWALQVLPAIVLVIGLFFLPLSPRWLGAQDRWDEAIQVLANLHGQGDVRHPKVLAEYQEIEEALSFEREHAVSSFKGLVEPRILRRVLLGMSVQMWGQLSGMNVMSEPIPLCLWPETVKSLLTYPSAIVYYVRGIRSRVSPAFISVPPVYVILKMIADIHSFF
jgi:hypothetical protein